MTCGTCAYVGVCMITSTMYRMNNIKFNKKKARWFSALVSCW